MIVKRSIMEILGMGMSPQSLFRQSYFKLDISPTTTFHITTTCWILLRRFETPKKGQIRAFLQVSNALKRRSNAKRRCNVRTYEKPTTFAGSSIEKKPSLVVKCLFCISLGYYSLPFYS